MKVGIVGAGISGLAAGRTLAAKGHESVLWERRSEAGGRIETLSLEGFVFDTGATSIAPRGMALESAMLSELNTADLVLIEKPIYTHHALRVVPGDARRNKTERYTYRSGNAELARLLSEGLDLRLDMQVEEITRSGQSFVIRDEAFDALILTPPVPQTSVLLWTLRESRPVANAKYRSCLAVLLGFNLPTPETSYHALLDVEQRHPLTWLTLESAKCEGRAPEGSCAIVAQMSPGYSLMHYNDSDEAIIEDTLIYVRRLYGEEYAQPTVAQVRRWKFSLPDTVAAFETVNHEGARLILAGDGLTAGRVEQAYESGVRAAHLLLS